VNLSRGEIASDALEVSKDLVDERFLLSRLLHDEVTATPVCPEFNQQRGRVSESEIEAVLTFERF